MSFKSLGLNNALLKAVEKQGYNSPSPIQEKAIPLILEGKDVLASAQTGTGKTAGFSLPMLQILNNTRHPKFRPIRALVLTPTRELASQVGDSFRDYGRNLRFKTAVIYGGVSIKTQKNKLRNGIDIVVATPGRLLDHLNQKTLNLSEIEVFVLDIRSTYIAKCLIKSTDKKSLNKKKNGKDKSILGQNAIFTPDVINDIHIKSELGRYRMRGMALFKKIPHSLFYTRYIRKKNLLSKFITSPDGVDKITGLGGKYRIKSSHYL